MGDWLKEDGIVRELLTKTGQLIMLTLVWLLCCVPIVTFVASSTAFYYAVVKSVRHEVGYPVEEFFRSFKSNLLRGFGQTIGIAIWMGLLVWNWNMLKAMKGSFVYWMMIGQITLYLVTAVYLVTLFPAMSRFSLKGWQMTKLVIVMGMKHAPVAALSLIGYAVIALISWYLTAAMMLVLPGIWVFCTTYWVEGMLLKFMPPPEENDTAWYYEDLKEKKNG